jgi:hypothetical protein
MKSRGGRAMLKEAQDKKLRMEITWYWVMDGSPQAPGIQYCLLTFPGLGREVTHSDEGAGQTDRCSLNNRDDV